MYVYVDSMGDQRLVRALALVMVPLVLLQYVYVYVCICRVTTLTE